MVQYLGLPSIEKGTSSGHQHDLTAFINLGGSRGCASAWSGSTALSRWMPRLRRAFNTVEKIDRRIRRLERQTDALSGR